MACAPQAAKNRLRRFQLRYNIGSRHFVRKMPPAKRSAAHSAAFAGIVSQTQKKRNAPPPTL
jgi:hypothetical protein